jgi:hypothetical protein
MYYNYLKQIRKAMDKMEQEGSNTKTPSKPSNGLMSYRKERQEAHQEPKTQDHPQKFMIDYFKTLREIKNERKGKK